MKKSIIILILTLFIPLISLKIYAQTELTEKTATSASQTASGSAVPVDAEVEDLKEKIATKVAELRSAREKAVAGTVTSRTDTSLTLKAADLETYEISLNDSLTEVYQITTGFKSIDASDIAKDDYLIVTGPRLDNTIDASAIYRDEHFLVRSGKIIEVNGDDFSVRVSTPAKETFTIDIERNTVQELLNIQTVKPEKIGFSKIKEGDTIHFAAEYNEETTDEGRVSGIRILIIPQEFFLK